MTLDKVPRKITYEYETLQETYPRKITKNQIVAPHCSYKKSYVKF